MTARPLNPRAAHDVVARVRATVDADRVRRRAVHAAATRQLYGGGVGAGQQRIEAAQRQEVGGTIKIEVDDRRTRVTQVRSSGGVQLDVAGGLSLGGNL